MKTFAFTVTRASTPMRARLLSDTITAARKTAGTDFHWYVAESGCGVEGMAVLDAAFKTGAINEIQFYRENVGQHVAWNDAFEKAKAQECEYFLRLDDDCEFISKRWLKKLVLASARFDDKFILSPTIRGLRNPPERSTVCYHQGEQIEFLRHAIGGICRLHPMNLLIEHAYKADVRKPLGSGDATGIAEWCKEYVIPMAYLKRIRVRHAKTTDVQEQEDKEHFAHHDIFQHIPYIPSYTTEV